LPSNKFRCPMKVDIHSLQSRLAKINEFDGNLRLGAGTFNKITNRSGLGRPSDGGLTREQSRVVIDTGVERFQRREGLWQAQDICPVCDSGDRHHFVHRLGLDYWRCTGCTHVFQDPILTLPNAIKLYSDDRTSADIYTTDFQKQIDWMKYQYGIDVIDSIKPPGHEKIIDIGCGAGVFLQVALESGWGKCIGIDANDNYRPLYSEEKGIQFINGNFEAIGPSVVGRDYDVVAMWSVLEHIYDPARFLETIRGIMKPGGLMFLLVPNVKSLATRLMREMSPCFSWKHLAYFSPHSLTALLNRCGFELEFMETIITEIDNIKSYMSGEYPYHGYGDPESLFDFITPEYIHSHLLGSRILAVYRVSG